MKPLVSTDLTFSLQPTIIQNKQTNKKQTNLHVL